MSMQTTQGHGSDAGLARGRAATTAGRDAALDGVEVQRCGPDPETVAVSVVIATFNRVESLLRLLADLAAQELASSFEVVVVDDGGRVDVLGELANRSCTFALTAMRRPNGGPGVARHSGILASRGEVIVIVDDDMALGPDFLAAHLRAHQRGAEVVLGRILAPDDDHQLSLFDRFHLRGLDRFVAEHQAGRATVEGQRLATGNVSFRRSAYDDVGGFDLSLRRCEDRDLGIRFELAGKVLAFADDARSVHRSDHEDAATWRRRSRLFGEIDQRIMEKFPETTSVSPWAFLPKLPAATRPLLVAAALLPRLGSLAAGVSYRVGLLLDLAPLRQRAPGPAMAAASLAYAFEYYSGVGAEIARTDGHRAVLASLRRHRAAAAEAPGKDQP